MNRVEVLPATTESPATARTLVRAELVGCNEEVVTAAELMISELVTNTVMHGSAPIRIEIRLDTFTVKATVTDSSSGLPVLTAAGMSNAHGRGLMIVSSLAHDWGIVECETGKSVWFILSYR